MKKRIMLALFLVLIFVEFSFSQALMKAGEELFGRVTVLQGVKVGNDTHAQAGTIRWDGSNFEGYNGSAWVTLDVQSTSGGGWTDGGDRVYITTAADSVALALMKAYNTDGLKFFDSAGNLVATIIADQLRVASAMEVPGIEDEDNDTKIQVEESADEDKIRFDTGGTERLVIDSDGIKSTGGYFLGSPSDRGGTSLYFDGVDDYLTIPDDTDIQFGTGDFTIGFWMYVPSIPSSTKSLWNKDPNGSYFYMTLKSTGIIGVVNARTEGASDFTTALTANKWYYIVATREDGTVKNYLNGVLDVSYSGTAKEISASGTDLTFSRANSYYLNCEMKEYYFNNRALTADEIQSIYSAGTYTPEFKYQGASQTELVTNGDFANWTTDDPDDWTVSGESGTDPEISEVGAAEGHGGSLTGACNIYSTSATTYIRQDLGLTVGKNYVATFDVTVVSGSIILWDYATANSFSTVSSSGTKTVEFTATDAGIAFKRNAQPCDVTIDNVSVVASGNVAHYTSPGIDHTNSVWHDESGNNLDGTISGASAVNQQVGLHLNKTGGDDADGVITVSQDGVMTAYVELDGDGYFNEVHAEADVDWNGIYAGESSSKRGFMSWRNTLERLECGTDTYNYPYYINGSVLVLQSESGGKVGIGETAPDSTLEVNGSGHFTGNVLVDGKFTATGGVDPPYISFSAETPTSIREYAKGLKDDQVVMQFFNTLSHRIEVYYVEEDAFYNMEGVKVIYD